MSRTVFCVKLKKEAEGFEKPPYPGELGERIYQQISKEAWKLWLGQQTILINEHRLSMANPEHRAFIKEKMESFLFA